MTENGPRFQPPVIESDQAERPFPLKALGLAVAAIVVTGVAIGASYVQFFRVVPEDPDTVVQSQEASIVQFVIPGSQNLSVLIDGERIDPAQPQELAPGQYELSTGLPFIAFPEPDRTLVVDSDSEEPTTVSVQPQLTNAGRSALLSAAKQSLDSCLAQKSLTPDGCPNHLDVDEPINADSVQWRLTSDPWSRAMPTLDPDDLSVAILNVSLATAVEFTFADGAASGRTPQQHTVQVRADLTGDSTDDIAVIWQE